jgi:iron complex transport system substrate-binding protein
MPAFPANIVSINLCADQYLLALADRGQIAAVTTYARDPGMSAAAGLAKGIPATRASAEELLTLRPGLLLAAPYQVAAKAALLPATRIVAVPEANDVPAIEANIRAVAAAVGHPERGRALIATLRAALVALPHPNPPHAPLRVGGGGDPLVLPPPPPAKPECGEGRGGVIATRNPPVVAQYQRGGYLTGTGTLVDDLIRRAGLVNLATVLHRPPLSRLSLEEIIAAKPDYLLIEQRTGTAGDRGAAMLDHPALARAFPAARRLVIDGAWTVCGGPAYPRAVASLRAQLTPSTAPLPLPARRSSSPARR